MFVVARVDPDCVASMDPDCVASITGLVQGCEAESSKQLQVSKVFDSGSRMSWFIEIWKPFYYLYNPLATQTRAVEQEPEFQTTASTQLCASLQSSKIAWAAAPHPDLL